MRRSWLIWPIIFLLGGGGIPACTLGGTPAGQTTPTPGAAGSATGQASATPGQGVAPSLDATLAPPTSVTGSGELGGGAAPSTEESPSEVQRLENLVAFTCLLGYVRYFHPSDEVAALNWDDFAVAHIESVENALDAPALAAQLRTLFSPYAPSLRLFTLTVGPPDIPGDLIQPTTTPLSLTMWAHSPYRSVPQLSYTGSRDSRPPLRVQVPVGGQPPYSTQVALHEFLWPPPPGWTLSQMPAPFHQPVTLTLPAPTELLQVELGGGVGALIPMTLWADAGGTLPRAPIPPPTVPSASQELTRGTRLAVVAIVWNTFQHLFPYWDEVDVDWGGALREALQGAAVAPDGAALTRVLQVMLAKTQDGHLVVGNERHANLGPSTAGRLPLTWDLVEGVLTVTTVMAPMSGPVAPGDQIEAINGDPSAEVIAAELALVPHPTEAYAQFRALSRLLAGPVGSTVELMVRPAGGGQAITMTLKYLSPSTNLASTSFIREPRPDVVAQLSPGIFYVDLTRLADDQVGAVIKVLADARGIVFDMRGYPPAFAPVTILAHLTERPLASAPMLAPVVTQPDHHAMQFFDIHGVWGEPQVPRLTKNVAFLTNANDTISKAETILGMVDGHHLGMRVGAATAGTNGDTVSQRLPGGYQVRWTGIKVLQFDGSRLYGVGIPPTHPATRTLAGVAAGRDELLEAGFAAVSGQPPSAMRVERVILPRE